MREHRTKLPPTRTVNREAVAPRIDCGWTFTSILPHVPVSTNPLIYNSLDPDLSLSYGPHNGCGTAYLHHADISTAASSSCGNTSRSSRELQKEELRENTCVRVELAAPNHDNIPHLFFKLAEGTPTAEVKVLQPNRAQI